VKESTRNQTGSPSRDIFKRRHKDLNKSLYALDIDFALIEKYPYPKIVAILDFKTHGDEDITFAEVIAYNTLIERGIPVFIVTGDPEEGVFQIFRYMGGHHKKPSSKLKHVANTENWQQFEQWEKDCRRWAKAPFEPDAEPAINN
jgi:hypothetical protein